MTIERSCLPCGGSVRRHNERLCPCKAQADSSARMSAATWPTDFLVDALDRDLGVLGHGDLDVLRDREQNRMREAEAQVEVLSLHGGLETDALDLEILVKPCYAHDHVVDQGARETVQRLHAAGLRAANKRDLVVGHVGLDSLRQRPAQVSLSGLRPRPPPSSMFTLTLAGISTALFPIRDITVGLPDESQQLASDVLFLRFAAGHDSARGGKN